MGRTLRAIALLCGLFLLAGSLGSSRANQASDVSTSVYTADRLNCRAIRGQDAFALGFVIGFREGYDGGLGDIQQAAGAGKVTGEMISAVDAQQFGKATASFGEFSDALKSFCAAPENSNVALADGLYIIAQKFNGLPPDKVEVLSAAARRIASSPPITAVKH